MNCVLQVTRDCCGTVGLGCLTVAVRPAPCCGSLTSPSCFCGTPGGMQMWVALDSELISSRRGLLPWCPPPDTLSRTTQMSWPCSCAAAWVCASALVSEWSWVSTCARAYLGGVLVSGSILVLRLCHAEHAWCACQGGSAWCSQTGYKCHGDVLGGLG